jgi:hypothetical protein
VGIRGTCRLEMEGLGGITIVMSSRGRRLVIWRLMNSESASEGIEKSGIRGCL